MTAKVGGPKHAKLAQLEARWPEAAASLREGLEDMFTVRGSVSAAGSPRASRTRTASRA
jgi:hypothetical protein